HSANNGVDGVNGLSSELGVIIVNGVQVFFGDPPEPMLPADAPDLLNSGSPVVATASGQFIGTGDFANSGQAGLLSVTGGDATVALAGAAGLPPRAVANPHVGAVGPPPATGAVNP